VHRPDIFVSYAHVDNQLVPGATKGWISALIDVLKVRLAQSIGRSDAFSVWMDKDLAGNGSLTANILENLKSSSLLLVVLSPAYVASPWCQRESSTFLATLRTLSQSDARVFVLEHTPLDEGTRPVEFGDVLGYRFWDADENGIPATLSPIAPTYKEQLFHLRVNKLVSDLTKALATMRPNNHVRAEVPSIAAPATSPASHRRAMPLPLDQVDPDRAAGLFVGVGEFNPRAYLASLRFAPDDAIALAHLFSIELNLIAPSRTSIALSGAPAATRSIEMLQALRAAGASIVNATRVDLLYAMDDFVERGRGECRFAVMAFSTHGYEEGGTAYLMPADGARRFVSMTGLNVNAVHETFERAGASQRLLILDTCRGSLDSLTRGETVMTDGFRQALVATPGTALLTSCSIGQSSWESPELEHGVFTHFLIEGIRGDASAGSDDAVIRLENVVDYTLQRTTDWVRRVIKAEQLPWFSGGADSRSLALAISVAARRIADERENRIQLLLERKERALKHLLAARARAENRRIIPGSIQAEVEKELDDLSSAEVDELLDMLERLADGKAASCRLFMLWWDAQPRSRNRHGLKKPSLGRPWENSLGMQFVPLGPHLIGAWLTRVRDFSVFVAETGYDATQGLFSLSGGKWTQCGDSWKSPGFPQSPVDPVAGVSWEDADAFCAWLSEHERASGCLGPSMRYRLPSDSEWSEAIGPTLYPWGDVWPPPPAAGRYGYAGSQSEALAAGTCPVATFAPNDKGIYDLGGNVWEWCDGWYAKEMNPPELLEQFEFLCDDGGGKNYRFMRGASWYNSESWQLRSAYRNTGKVPNVRFSNVGFRCVLDWGAQGVAPDFRP